MKQKGVIDDKWAQALSSNEKEWQHWQNAVIARTSRNSLWDRQSGIPNIKAVKATIM